MHAATAFVEKTMNSSSYLRSALGLQLFLGACGDDKHAAPDAPIGVNAAQPDTAPPAPGLTLLDYAFAIDVTPDAHTALFENLEQDGDTISNQGVTKTSLPDPSKNIVPASAIAT
jgi:hypothetical protein